MPAIVLRDFTYLNVDLVQTFLAQLEGGITQEAQTRTTENAAKGADAGVSAGPLQVKANLKKGAGQEVSQTVSQTPSSELARLHRLLAAAGGIQELEAMDEAIWGQVEKNEVVELQVVVEVAGMAKAMLFLREAEKLAPLLKLFGAVDEAQLETVLGMNAAFGSADKDKLPLVARLVGTPRFHFFAQLDVDHLEVEPSDMEGEMTLLGKVQRKLPAGEKFPIPGGFPGLDMVPGQQRKKLLRGMKPEDAGGAVGPLVMTGPGGIVTPIALYR
jgi:hypothetical protein